MPAHDSNRDNSCVRGSPACMHVVPARLCDGVLASACRYNWGKGSDAYTKGDGYAQIALSTEVRLLQHPLLLRIDACDAYSGN